MKITQLFATTLLASIATFAFAAPETAKSATAAAKASTPAKATAAPAKAPAGKADAATAGDLLDINTASREDLIKQPAIGAAIADKIIAGRPWKAKSDLVSKNVMNKAAYDKVAKLIIAKQAKGDSNTTAKAPVKDAKAHAKSDAKKA